MHFSHCITNIWEHFYSPKIEVQEDDADVRIIIK